MSKFNVGDRVVIREWDDMAEEYGLTPSSDINCRYIFAKGMRYLCGREFTIKAIDYKLNEGYVEFEENNDWNYHIDMIRPAYHKDLNIPSSDLIDNLIFS